MIEKLAEIIEERGEREDGKALKNSLYDKLAKSNPDKAKERNRKALNDALTTIYNDKDLEKAMRVMVLR